MRHPGFSISRSKYRAWLVAACTLCTGVLHVSCADTPRTGGSQREQRSILVFAAASLREALDEIAGDYERETSVHVDINLAGSNTLARQILATHKADVYISAGEEWMDTVERRAGILPGTRRHLLSNRLVIVAHSNSDYLMDSPCDLARRPPKHLAVGDPASVPAGRYARDWMTSMRCDGVTLWSAVRGIIVPAPDVRAALGLVTADPNTVGIVYRTDQIANPRRVRVLAEISNGPEAKYSSAVIATAPHRNEAVAFNEYLASKSAARVFASHGFIVPGGFGRE